MGNIIPSAVDIFGMLPLNISAFFGATPHSPTCTKAVMTSSPPSGVTLKRKDLRDLVLRLASHVRSSMKEQITKAARNPQYRLEILKACEKLPNILSILEPYCELMERRCPEFDLDASTSGNGYRSFLNLVDLCLLRIARICFVIRKERDDTTFKGSFYAKELEAYVAAVEVLSKMARMMAKCLDVQEAGELFLDPRHPLAQPTMAEFDTLDQSPFFGRCTGFQFHTSLQQPLNVISISMAAYSSGYTATSASWAGRAARTLLSAGSYVLNPEQRALRNVQMTRSADVHFCKAFWALGDVPALQTQFTALANPRYLLETLRLRVSSRVLKLPCNLPLAIDGITLDALPPPSEISVRLICPKHLENRTSDRLLFHVHGGGFVAQSSKTHEVYLLDWADRLRMPILSVDYSLAPEHPHPRALNETVYAYIWTLLNAESIGWSGNQVVFVGDSAGALICTSTCLKLAALGITRRPQALVPLYAAFVVQNVMSPSRSLSLVDPILPIGILLRCLSAYTGVPDPGVGSPAAAQAKDRVLFTLDETDDESLSPTEVDVIGKTEGYVEMIMDRSSFRGLQRSTSLSTSAVAAEAQEEGIAVHSTKDQSLIEVESENIEFSAYIRKFTRKRGGSTSDEVKQRLPSGSLKRARQTASFSLGDSVSSITSYVGTGLTDYLQSLQEEPLKAIPEEGPCSYKPATTTATSLIRFMRLKVSNSRFLSPYFATPEQLNEALPPVHMIACHMDPLLDDSVMFARKLRQASVPMSIEFVEALPHGFLNFTHLNPLCRRASRRCVDLIAKAFNHNC